MVELEEWPDDTAERWRGCQEQSVLRYTPRRCGGEAMRKAN